MAKYGSNEWRSADHNAHHHSAPGRNNNTSASIPGASLNLINSIAGAAIVAIPHAIQQCGLFLGLVLLIFLAYAMHNIITVLMDCALRAGELNLEDLAGVYFGPRGRTITSVVMLMYAVGSMVACMVVVGDTLPPAMGDLFGFQRIRSRDEIIVIVAVMVVLPLSLVRNVSSLAFASGVALLAIVVLVLGVLTQGPAEAHAQGLTFDIAEITIVNQHLFRGIGVLSFHYVCQHSCLLIFKSLEKPCLDDVRQVSRLSLGAVLLMSLLLGLGGYIIFGDTIDGNVLNNYESHATAISLARICMAINMIFTYPMELFVARHACFSLLTKLNSDIDRPDLNYELADTSSQQSMGSWDMRSDLRGSSNSERSSDSGCSHTLEMENAADEFVHVGLWKDVVRSDLRFSSRPPLAEDSLSTGIRPDVTPPLAFHVLMTIILWSLSLAIAVGFEDVSVVLSLSGIVAASCLGYIVPVAIYLKTHEEKVRSKFFESNIVAVHFGVSDEWSDSVKNADSADQKDFDHNVTFFIILGVFGVCSLVVGLIIEVLSLFRVAEGTDPTVNY